MKDGGGASRSGLMLLARVFPVHAHRLGDGAHAAGVLGVGLKGQEQGAVDLLDRLTHGERSLFFVPATARRVGETGGTEKQGTRHAATPSPPDCFTESLQRSSQSRRNDSPSSQFGHFRAPLRSAEIWFRPVPQAAAVCA